MMSIMRAPAASTRNASDFWSIALRENSQPFLTVQNDILRLDDLLTPPDESAAAWPREPSNQPTRHTPGKAPDATKARRFKSGGASPARL